jgi:5-methylcytosine-specific restriction endonuclease McrA
MRAKFTKPTKREALKRSLGTCEARGRMYGLRSGQRCLMPLSYGVEFDHVVLAANGGDNSLENCAAVCKRCHKIKTTEHDTPMAAKTVRLQDNHSGVGKKRGWPKSKWKRKVDGTTELRNDR